MPGVFGRNRRPDNSSRARLANMCQLFAQWPDTEATLSAAGAQDALNRIRATVSAQSVDDTALISLLDVVDRVGLSIGLEGVTTRTRGYRPLPPGLSAESVTVVWVCPHRCCERVVLPEESVAAPDCRLGPDGTPMAEDHL